MLLRATVLVAIAALASAQSQSTSTDWPRWRGPKGDGSVATALPADWPAALTKRWEVAVGEGHSSPVIAGTRVAIFTRQADKEIARTLDLATGRELWRADYAAPYTVNPAAQAHGQGPKSTPAIAGSRLFTYGIGGILSAFDLATGKLLWRTPPPALLPAYGTATSPIVDGGVVIAHTGGKDNGAMTAFDVATGAPRWRWTGDSPAYGTPVIATIGGQRQLIAQTQKLMVGLNADNGTLLWKLPFTTSFNQSAVTPIVRDDMVIYSGLEKPTTAVRIRRTGTQWTAEPAWQNDQVSMFMSSAFLSGTTLYGLSHRNKGQWFALDVATGKTLWTTTGREAENASLFGNPSWLLLSTTNGELIVARASIEKFTEVRRYQVADSAMWAHPAIAGRSIVVKGADKLTCWSW